MSSYPHDELFDKALEIVIETGKASSAFLQRRMSIGYARAARIMDQLELEGYIGPAVDNANRKILVSEVTKPLIEKAKEESKRKKEEQQQIIKEWYVHESDKYKDYDPSVLFPWPDVASCLDKKVSTHAYRTSQDYKNDPKNRDVVCPKCKKELQELNVVYFRSPDWTWGEDLCGRAGWLVICTDCNKQVHFDMEVMS
jgi:hypothetical protein